MEEREQTKLSITQSYLLCVLNEKGKLPTFGTEAAICLVAGGVLDLIFSGCVKVEDKKLGITDKLVDEKQYLKSLYELIKDNESITLKKIASEYCFSLTDKKLKALVEDVGTSLAKVQCVKTEQGGFFGSTTCFIPDAQAVDDIVQRIRAEILEEDTLSEEMIALASLLEKSNEMKQYFSKYEKKQLKERLEIIRKESSNQLVKEMVDYINTMIAIIVSIG